jgi:hypothetical protein
MTLTKIALVTATSLASLGAFTAGVKTIHEAIQKSAEPPPMITVLFAVGNFACPTDSKLQVGRLLICIDR